MSTTSPTSPTSPTLPPLSPTPSSATAAPGRLRRLVAVHPVTTFLLSMFGVGWGLMFPAGLAGLPIEPFLLATVLLGQLLPAVLISAADGGRPAVRHLFARTFRWRTGTWPWLVALLGLPLVSVVLVSTLLGNGAARLALTDPHVLLSWLAAFSILPVVNLWEETGIAGFLQHRLTERHGLVRGALLTAPAFALIHLPLQLGRTPAQAAIGMATLLGLAVPFRLMIGALYRWSGRSTLLVAVLHASFNATNNGTLLSPAGSDHRTVATTGVWAVVAVAGAVVAVRELVAARRNR